MTPFGNNPTVSFMFELPVTKIDFYTSDIFEVCLERGEYSFETGECSVLFNDVGDSRPYSMSSAPQADELSFLVRRLPGGALSEWLAERKPGDSVCVSAPFGEFRPAFDSESLVLIATGVGISPFLSLIRGSDEDSSLSRPLSIYGLRRLAEAVELELLKQKTALQLAVSREPHTPHFHGRVTDLVDTLPIKQNTEFYLCGYDSMVNGVSDRLTGRGVHPARIHTEVFFN